MNGLIASVHLLLIHSLEECRPWQSILQDGAVALAASLYLLSMANSMQLVT